MKCERRHSIMGIAYYKYTSTMNKYNTCIHSLTHVHRSIYP